MGASVECEAAPCSDVVPSLPGRNACFTLILVLSILGLPAEAAGNKAMTPRPAQLGTSHLPASLAGYKLDETVPVDFDSFSGEGKCKTDRSMDERFASVSCKASAKGKIYEIEVIYSDPPTFDNLLKARSKKLGPPARGGCEPPFAGEIECAIWENEKVKMTLYHIYGNFRGVPFNETGLSLISKTSRDKAEQDAKRYFKKLKKEAIEDDRRRAEEMTRDE